MKDAVQECAYHTLEEHACYVLSAFGTGKSLMNWLFDSRASAHMMPYESDLENIESYDVIITLTDG
jgi:hypothetical protein